MLRVSTRAKPLSTIESSQLNVASDVHLTSTTSLIHSLVSIIELTCTITITIKFTMMHASVTQDDPVAVMRPQPQSNPLFVRGTIPPSPSQQDGSLTVAAHLTSDRLSSLDQLCRLYPGRIAASVYVPKRNLSTLAQWCDADRSCMCGDPTKSRITLKYSLHDGLTRAFGQLYPVNSLRNQALMAVNTEFTLGLDADFVVGGPADAIPRPPPYTVYVLPCFKVSPPSTPLIIFTSYMASRLPSLG